MADPRIIGIGRAVPQARYTQRDLYALSPWETSPLIEKLFLDSAIEGRGLFVPPDWYRQPRTLTQTNEAWRQGALHLGGQALLQALRGTDTTEESVDLLAVTTVTGYATPGLDLLLAQQLGLRNTLARAHFNCIGCHAAVPLLKVAADHAARRPGSTAIALAVEICSACFRDDGQAQNLVALSLFADGAAAAVVSTKGVGPRIVDFGSVYDFDHLDALGFGLTANGFRIVLDPAIPKIIANHIEAAVDGLLERHALGREDVSMWCLHPGGSKILDACQDRLGLSDEAMGPSRHVLRQHGNMSSPSVLFVLSEGMRTGQAITGKYAILAAFGPGLGIEVGLLAFEDA